MYLLNAFSANMLAEFPVSVHFVEISATVMAKLAQESVSAVGHADTAALFSAILGIEVPCNRISITLKSGENALLGQYSGPRLPEGATTLPEGASIKWVLINVF